VIGVTGQYSATDKLLTGRENLMLMADLYHLGRGQGKRPRTEELLERFRPDHGGGASWPPPTPAACSASSTWQ